MKPAHVVAQAPALGYCVGHMAVTSEQKPSHGMPQAPPPLGPAWTQCVPGSACARFAWLMRQPSVLPL